MGRWRTHPDYEKNHVRYMKNREEILERARLKRLGLHVETFRERNIRLRKEAKRQRELEHQQKRAELHKRRLDSSEYVEAQELVRNYKENNPCQDCGHHFRYFAMDFDHVRGEKKTDISSLVGRIRKGGVTVGALIEEIEKCELVCAVCHRVRTFTRSSTGQS